MGNTLTIQENEVTKKRNGEWRVLSEGYGCNVVESQTGIRAEQYKVSLDEKSWELNNIKIYEFRRVQNSHLVKVFSVQADSINSSLLVRTQLIPYRLADISDLTPDESLYVALYSLIGFRYIYELCQRRLFSVNDSMIGFTPEGNVKVWINSNFALNELDINAFKVNPVKVQTEIVNLILNFVSKHTRGGKLPQRFLVHYNSKPARSISDTLRCFKSFLQSENVLIASRVDFNGKLAGSSVPRHGYYQKVQIPAEQIINVQSVQNNANIQDNTPYLGQQYTSNITNQLPRIQQQIPQIPARQEQIPPQNIQRQQLYVQEGAQSVYSQNVGGYNQNHNHPQSPLSHLRQPNQFINNRPFNRNPYEQQLPSNFPAHLDPRIHRTSTLGYPQRTQAQSQIYTRHGTNNFPIPSNAINNINLQKTFSGSIRPHHQFQPRQQRGPVAQAQLAPAIGSTTKVIGVTRYDNYVVQQGKVNETVLTTQKQINEAMNPQMSLNNVYLNPQANQTAKVIKLQNLQEIKKYRAPVDQDYISGENRNLSFVDPEIQKMMMLPKDRIEQVHYNSPLNNISTTANPLHNISGLVESITPTQQIHTNNFVQTNLNHTPVIDNQRKRSHASNLSYDNRSNYSSLSKKSNRSFKADKLVLMGGKVVASNPVEITEVNSSTTPVQRVETTVYHQISSYGLNPTIKQESPYSYSAYEQVPLSIPKSPYRQNIHSQIIQEHVQYSSKYR